MRSEGKYNSLKKLKIAATVSVLISILTAGGVFCYLFVDFGEERRLIEIPELVGRSFNDIGEIDGIRLESEPIFSSDAPEGEVVSQTPYGGARRKVADGEKYTVRVTVSLGKETVSVPKLEGFGYTDAAAALRKMGAKIKIVSVYDDEKDHDVVLRTLPKAGERIGCGESVTLFVSRKHMRGSVAVKNFVGMTKEEAALSILEQGLALGEISAEKNGKYPVGRVASQSILPGSYVLHGTEIDISISAEAVEDLHPFRKDLIQKDGELNESVD